MHEYGHDLQDLRRTVTPKYSGKGTGGDLVHHVPQAPGPGSSRGTEPTRFSPWARSSSGLLRGNWLHSSNVQLADLNPRGNVYMLDQAKRQRDATTMWCASTCPPNRCPQPPYAGQYQYHGGKGNNLDNRMGLKLDLGGSQSSSLLFKAWYRDREDGADYGRVLVNGRPIPGNLTTSDDPNRIGFGVGITGNSNGWTDAGVRPPPLGPASQIALTLQYQSDGGVAENRLFVDELPILADGDTPAERRGRGRIAAFTPGRLCEERWQQGPRITTTWPVAQPCEEGGQGTGPSTWPTS